MILFGIDIVVYSVIKYLNGYGDVVVGFVCGIEEYINLIKMMVLKDIGVMISFYDVWLINCGLKIFVVCMECYCVSV